MAVLALQSATRLLAHRVREGGVGEGVVRCNDVKQMNAQGDRHHEKAVQQQSRAHLHKQHTTKRASAERAVNSIVEECVWGLVSKLQHLQSRVEVLAVGEKTWLLALLAERSDRNVSCVWGPGWHKIDGALCAVGKDM